MPDSTLIQKARSILSIVLDEKLNGFEKGTALLQGTFNREDFVGALILLEYYEHRKDCGVLVIHIAQQFSDQVNPSIVENWNSIRFLWDLQIPITPASAVEMHAKLMSMTMNTEADLDNIVAEYIKNVFIRESK